MNLLKLSVLSLAFLCGASWISAQTARTMERGSMLHLSAEPGADGYQWQVSSDGRHFVDLPHAVSQHLSVQVNAPAFYRVARSAAGAVTYGTLTNVSLSEIEQGGQVSVTSGAHGYVETREGKSGTGIQIPEDSKDHLAVATQSLTGWTNGDAVAVSYIHHPSAVVDTRMDINVKAGASSSFCLKVFDPEHLSEPLATTYVAVEGTGSTQEVFLVGLELPHEGYYRYVLECLEGWENINAIERLRHYSPSQEKSYKNAFLSSPSVHLTQWSSTHPDAPRGNVYEWCYQEVMMPEESDIPGTYIMSLGVLDGYMGIQMNGHLPDGRTRHDVIFSMWDKGNTDIDPDLADHLRAKLLDKNPLAIAERFGNEGTGQKTFMAGHFWECGQFVQFITNCRSEKGTYTVIENGQEVTKEQENTLVSAWFNAQDGKGWQYISTLRLPKSHKRFDTWYSFLENYKISNGQMLRKGYYRNGYACTTVNGSPRWYHFNKVSFGHTDGGSEEGKRNDYGQGATTECQGDNGEEAFFMQNGGFLDTKITAREIRLNRSDRAVDTIRLDVLRKRVDEAIAHEQYVRMQDEYWEKNKISTSAWRVVDFSSEETSGEGSNGRAAFILDGDKDTYWHSAWQSGRSRCPHHITVDMTAETMVDALRFTMSGGTRRYMKAFNVYAGTPQSPSAAFDDSQVSWDLVYATADAPKAESFRVLLDHPARARYLKLEITGSRATDGDHVRVNEMEVFAHPRVSAPLQKQGWEVIEFSSEETSGEGPNGFARLIVDGDPDTYWHSAWASGTAQTPHILTVDMKQANLLESMRFQMSGGTARQIRAFNVYTSSDRLQWKKVYSDMDAPDASSFEFSLPESTMARYFRLEILSSRDAGGVHTRVNEIDVSGRALSPAESLLMEAEDCLANPDARNVGYPVQRYLDHVQSARDALLSAVDGVDEGVALTMALNVYKSTAEIRLPENQVIYTLTSAGRGSLTADVRNGKLQSTRHSSVNVASDYRDVNQQFTFVERDGRSYLYNCALKKYMTGNADVLSDEPQDPIFLLKHESHFGTVFMKFDDSHNVNFGGSSQLLVDGWNQHDAGNSFTVEPVGVLADMKPSAGALRAQRIATFSSPFAVVPEAGATAYFANADETRSAILLQRIPEGQAIPEATGVLVTSDDLAQVRLVKADGDAATAECRDNVLLGSADGPVVMQTGDYILLQPQQQSLAFYKARPGSVLPRYRAYLHLSGTPASAVRMIVAEEETGIGSTLASEVVSAVYDLSGRQVRQVQKGGIYIRNGKKYVVK